MIDAICGEIRNYFIREGDVHLGTYEIVGGSLPPLPFAQDGQYVRIVGSAFNDGVYQYPATELVDETFKGAIWTMNLPKDFIEICREIDEYQASPAAAPSAYSSESFGGYAYTKNKDGRGQNAGWRDVFGSRLDRWRRARTI